MSASQQPGRFQPIELSDPELEVEYLRNLTFFSPALAGRGDVSLFVPPGIEARSPIPLVILLHGVYSSHWSWFFRGAAHRTALQLIQEKRIQPMILAAPSDGLSGDGTGYIPCGDKNFEAWICDDVLECVQTAICQPQTPTAVFIGGLSLGGFGAMRLGAKYPNRFCGIAAHSSITQINQLDTLIRDKSCFTLTPPQETDLLYWFDRHRETLPPLHFDCGEDDPLFAANLELHQALDRRQIPHQFQANPGDHSWPYWKAHLRETLLFFQSILDSTSRPSSAVLATHT